MLRPSQTFRKRRGFTLVEVLAALLFMAIIIPVAMHGMSVASRAGILGQRKVAAMRVAERVLDEMLVTGQINSGSSTGTTAEGDTSYPWTLSSQTWSEDSLTELTVTVSFELQGNTYDVSVSTLYDPTAVSAAAAAAAGTSA
jgi:prepilin-type N-terminal cleavage/methylation domain-containing protein